MRRLLRWIVRVLASWGFGRAYFHVDSGTALHLIVEVLDSATGDPVTGADVLVERPAEGREPGPRRVDFGRTNQSGRLDRTLAIRWSHEVDDPYGQHSDPPGMNAIVERSGYWRWESSFRIQALPTDGGGAVLLDLGRVSLVRS